MTCKQLVSYSWTKIRLPIDSLTSFTSLSLKKENGGIFISIEGANIKTILIALDTGSSNLKQSCYHLLIQYFGVKLEYQKKKSAELATVFGESIGLEDSLHIFQSKEE